MENNTGIERMTGQVKCRERLKGCKKNVILHNSESVSLEYVLLVLIKIFDKSAEDAMRIAEEAEANDTSIIGTYWGNIADSKVEQVKQFNIMFNMQLLVTTEEVDE